MDNDHPIAISEEEDEFLKDAFEEDRREPPEEKKSVWRKIVIIIIIILLLLLLFWPVPKTTLKRIRRQGQARQVSGAGVVGVTRYTVISGKPMIELDTKIRKAVPVGVWFEVENLSGRSELLDYSMVKLVNAGGYESVINPELIRVWYERSRVKNPWGEPVFPGRKVKALAVFYVYRGPVKNYLLRGRDFDWTSDNYGDFAVGAFDTRPGRP